MGGSADPTAKSFSPYRYASGARAQRKTTFNVIHWRITLVMSARINHRSGPARERHRRPPPANDLRRLPDAGALYSAITLHTQGCAHDWADTGAVGGRELPARSR